MTVLEKRIADSKFEILGTIQNNGKIRWENIDLDVEFYTLDGEFIEEACDSVSSAVDAGASEHFMVTIEDASDRIRDGNIHMEVKIADAFSSIF